MKIIILLILTSLGLNSMAENKDRIESIIRIKKDNTEINLNLTKKERRDNGIVLTLTGLIFTTLSVMEENKRVKYDYLSKNYTWTMIGSSMCLTLTGTWMIIKR